jgi:RNA 3'-terminal phosphate cyclase
MIIFMALASGESVLRCGSLTLHTESAIHVAQQLTGAQFLIMINVQDQMIIFMALASGESVLRCGSLTLHTESAIHVAQQLTGAHFSVRQETQHSTPCCQLEYWRISLGSKKLVRDFLFKQCCGSVTFWYGSGSADPYF